MEKLGVGLLAIAVLSFLNMAAAAQPSCTTCAKTVVLDRSDIECVRDKVRNLVSRDLAIVIVTRDGCDTDLTEDDIRIEVVPQRGKSGGKPAKEKYSPVLLSRSDAVCLLAKLEEYAGSQEEQVVFDLSRCEQDG